MGGGVYKTKVKGNDGIDFDVKISESGEIHTNYYGVRAIGSLEEEIKAVLKENKFFTVTDFQIIAYATKNSTYGDAFDDDDFVATIDLETETIEKEVLISHILELLDDVDGIDCTFSLRFQKDLFSLGVTNYSVWDETKLTSFYDAEIERLQRLK